MLRAKFTLSLLFIGFSYVVNAQIGGNGVYQFLDNTASARVAALGSGLLTCKQADLSAAQQNPALLDSSVNGHLSLNYAPYVSDITLGNVVYAYQYKKYTLASGIQFLRYGNFDGADASGALTNSFSAGDYAIYQSLAIPINKGLTVAGTAKLIISNFTPYSSYGIAADGALLYKWPEQLITAALMVKNLGVQITTYDGNARGNLPLEVQAGLTKKLSKAPVLFSFTIQHLEQWDLSRPNTPNVVADQLGISYDVHPYNNIAVNVLRHVIVGVELLPDKPFNILIAYNALRSTDFQYNDINSISDGVSFGFGLKIGAFRINYGRAVYHAPFSVNYFSITTNLNGLYTRAK